MFQDKLDSILMVGCGNSSKYSFKKIFVSSSIYRAFRGDAQERVPKHHKHGYQLGRA
jgi:hypothetical protein